MGPRMQVRDEGVGLRRGVGFRLHLSFPLSLSLVPRLGWWG